MTMPSAFDPVSLRQLELPRLLTNRIVVRIAAAEDVEEIVRYVRENADYLQRWEPLRQPSYYTVEYWRHQVARDTDDYTRDRGVRFFLFDRLSGGRRVLGVATFGNIV